MQNGNVKYWAIVPAAGRSIRMNAPKAKQYLKVAGKTIIEHSLAPLLDNPRIEKIVVVLAIDDGQWHNLAIAKHHKITTAIGGKERCHSVCKGVQMLHQFAKSDDWVLIHECSSSFITTTRSH